jgi:ABC-type glycerol-3-phosphate transport system substrate-binding protein
MKRRMAMKKFRNYLCILLTALLICSLFTGCGSGEAAQEETPADTAAATDAGSEAPSFDKLDVSMFTGGYTDMWKDLLALFQSYYPDVEITADLSDDNASRVRARMYYAHLPRVWRRRPCLCLTCTSCDA